MGSLRKAPVRVCLRRSVKGACASWPGLTSLRLPFLGITFVYLFPRVPPKTPVTGDPSLGSVAIVVVEDTENSPTLYRSP
jgi:hypothetical protein